MKSSRGDWPAALSPTISSNFFQLLVAISSLPHPAGYIVVVVVVLSIHSSCMIWLCLREVWMMLQTYSSITQNTTVSAWTDTSLTIAWVRESAHSAFCWWSSIAVCWTILVTLFVVCLLSLFTYIMYYSTYISTCSAYSTWATHRRKWTGIQEFLYRVRHAESWWAFCWRWRWNHIMNVIRRIRCVCLPRAPHLHAIHPHAPIPAPVALPYHRNYVLTLGHRNAWCYRSRMVFHNSHLYLSFPLWTDQPNPAERFSSSRFVTHRYDRRIPLQQTYFDVSHIHCDVMIAIMSGLSVKEAKSMTKFVCSRSHLNETICTI